MQREGPGQWLLPPSLSPAPLPLVALRAPPCTEAEAAGAECGPMPARTGPGCGPR